MAFILPLPFFTEAIISASESFFMSGSETAFTPIIFAMPGLGVPGAAVAALAICLVNRFTR